MLTTEQMNLIMIDMVLKRKTPRVQGKEANAFRKKIKPEIDEAKRKGWTIYTPSD